MRLIPWIDRFAFDRLWPRRRASGNGVTAKPGWQPDDVERSERLHWTVLEDVRELMQPPPANEHRPRRRRPRTP
jgi:hypothetical protein